ncbi:MAG: hypothetical protein JJV88_03700, partial [Sulfurovum sp.]|nr:hypothetical protein [Sulfurovaceae bacterium]
ILKRCTVLSKKRNSATIKQYDSNKTMYIYKMAQQLKVGGEYDLVVDDIKRYKGINQIIGIIDIKQTFRYNRDK